MFFKTRVLKKIQTRSSDSHTHQSDIHIQTKHQYTINPLGHLSHRHHSRRDSCRHDDHMRHCFDSGMDSYSSHQTYTYLLIQHKGLVSQVLTQKFFYVMVTV